MNKAGAWQCWKMSWDLYKIASGLDQKDEKIQVTTLLHVLGWNVWNFFQILCEIPRMIGIKLLPGKAKHTSYLFQEDKHSLSIVICLNTLRKPFEVINQLSKWFAYPFEKNEYPFEWLAYPFEWFAYLLEKFSIHLYDCNIRSNG